MLNFRRLFHKSATTCNIKKIGLKLNKMVNPKAKRQWYPTHFETDLMPSVKSLTKTKNEPGKRSMKRSAMLNKMFMKQITDIMSTGTVSMNIVGKGIEISKVKITADLQSVHVFWVCKGDSSDKDTEAVLNSVAGPLRHELSTLRVMGEVPYVVFVKDRHEAQLVELERRLAIADYGEDYTPTEMGHLLKTEFTLNTKLSSEMQAKIKQLDEEVPLIEEPIPEMTNNVYGLEHDKIMNRLLAAKKKRSDAWSRLEDSSKDDVISYRTSEARESVDVSNQKKDLAEFLMKRKILQNKIYKEMRASSEDWQLDYQQDEDTQPLDDTPCNGDDDYCDDYDEDEDYFYEHDFKVKDKNTNS